MDTMIVVGPHTSSSDVNSAAAESQSKLASGKSGSFSHAWHWEVSSGPKSAQKLHGIARNEADTENQPSCTASMLFPEQFGVDDEKPGTPWAVTEMTEVEESTYAVRHDAEAVTAAESSGKPHSFSACDPVPRDTHGQNGLHKMLATYSHDSEVRSKSRSLTVSSVSDPSPRVGKPRYSADPKGYPFECPVVRASMKTPLSSHENDWEDCPGDRTVVQDRTEPGLKVATPPGTAQMAAKPSTCHSPDTKTLSDNSIITSPNQAMDSQNVRFAEVESQPHVQGTFAATPAPVTHVVFPAALKSPVIERGLIQSSASPKLVAAKGGRNEWRLESSYNGASLLQNSPGAPLVTVWRGSASRSLQSRDGTAEQLLDGSRMDIYLKEHSGRAIGSPKLDVGVFDGVHGWLRVGAGLDASGRVTASLTTANLAAHDSLRAAIPELINYLAAEEVSVNKVSLHRVPDQPSVSMNADPHARQGSSSLTQQHQQHDSSSNDGKSERRHSSLADQHEQRTEMARTWMDGVIRVTTQPGLPAGLIGRAGGYWINVCA